MVAVSTSDDGKSDGASEVKSSEGKSKSSIEAKNTSDHERERDLRKHTYSVCTICDIGCQLRAETENGKLTRMIAHDNPLLARNVCYKGTAAPHIHNHPDRLTKPLKRVGERGGDQWEEISYEQALDEIAERLQKVVDKYGPESFVVSTSGWNTQTTHSMDRRFMNALGSPNYISGVSLCAGNTAAVNKLTYGWFPFADIANSKCVVLFGHNPRKHSWTCLLYTSPSPRDQRGSRMPSSA